MTRSSMGRNVALASAAVICLAIVVAEVVTGSGHTLHFASAPARRAAPSQVRWTSAAGSPPAAARHDLTKIKAAFARSEDVYEAMFAPPPRHIVARTALEDNMAVAPVATLDKSGRHAFLSTADQAVIQSRALAALDQVFTPAMARREQEIVVGVTRTLSAGQDLLGGGGASVVQFRSESINGATATITAAVRQWSRIGYVNPMTGQAHWQVNQAIVIVKDSLSRVAGSWMVASRTWNYAPGQGP